MNIEKEIFKKSKVNYNNLIDYGFIKENDYYKYSKIIKDGDFRVEIIIDNNQKITGKIYDIQMDEEYTNYRNENQNGSFVNDIRNEFKDILIDIKNNCFDTSDYIFDQSNRIANYILKKYNISSEFLWDSAPGYGVFRNMNNNKWFGIIMNIDASKLGLESKEVEIINVKVNEDVNDLIKINGIFKAYHMNKGSWISIILNDTLSDEDVIKYIDESYDIINESEEWIVPANPKYYDVVGALKNTDIIEWKQSSDIHVNDIVYLYLSQPYSAILYKFIVVETNIPYEYKSKELSIKNLMRIKLIKRYNKDDITFSYLNNLGIKAIRGPRRVDKNISKFFI